MIQLSQVMNMLKTSPVGATERSTGACPCVNGMFPILAL